ncbi:zinc-binding dehydrogenase [uncultured Jatrophihabitans sp.]|uniref:zinc-binding dehydrogenase n=1 Tax=uncultured Jatrophihabitans sp. TaxID=1610747 RepID=UPI0035C9815C
MTTHAAVVTTFDRPPRYQSFDVPQPSGREEVVDVLAAGLHPRVRSGAAGRHYTSSGTLPMVPGIDGVARRPDGRLAYFVADDEKLGSMAGQTVIDPVRSVVLPDDVDIAQVAATMNPAMSSWVALRRRVPLQEGQSVLVLGATGNAGTMAVRLAKRLGAGRVLGAGRDRTRLDALRECGADGVVALTDDVDATSRALAEAAAEVDVVLDYLWAEPARLAMLAVLQARSDRSRELNWVQIGAVAGPDLALPSVALRSANLRLQGNGQGAVSAAGYLAELPSLIDEIAAGSVGFTLEQVPLAAVEQAWIRPDRPGVRTVFIP